MSLPTRHGRDIQYLYPDVVYRFNNEFLSLWETENLSSADKKTSSKDALVVTAFFSKGTRTFHWIGLHHSMLDWSKNKKILENLLYALRSGYDLRLMSATSADDIVNEGESLVIVALVNNTHLHIRIFDDSGAKVVDKPECELLVGEALTALKQKLDPFPDDESSLKQDEKQKIIENATSCAGHTDTLESYLLDMPQGIEPYLTATKTLRRWVPKQTDSPGVDDQRDSCPTTNDEWEELHRAIAILYSGFHQRVDRGIEGVFYRFLRDCPQHATDHDYVLGELLPEWTDKKKRWEWLRIENTEQPAGYCCAAKSCEMVPYQNLYDPSVNSREEPEDLTKSGKKSPLVGFAERTFLSALLMTPNKFFERLGECRHVVLFPIHDVQVGEKGYGGIKALSVLFFEKPEFRENWLKNREDNMRDIGRPLAEEVTASAEVFAASAPIKPPYDLVRHFLKVLIYVQDWESAVVFKDGRFEYGFYRPKPPDEETAKCKWDLSNDEKIFDLDNGRNQQTDSTIHEVDNKRYLWWTGEGLTGSSSLWTKSLIPSLGDEESSRFSGISIRFEFPAAARFPEKEDDRKWLRDEYLREQLDLMRVLIPKVRARRASLRNAVVSIMARNMSHNIGSHVIAAVRGDSAAEIKQINRLNEHLQQRMDFIADLTTTEVQYAADNELFGEAFGLESTETEVTGKGERGLHGQYLLLRHISGTQTAEQSPIAAKIRIQNGSGSQAPVVSFRSGLLGWQALYVILENIIRNVAKHTGDCLQGGEIEIWVRVLDTHDDFFELRIWDRYGTACTEVRDKPGVTVVSYLAGQMKDPSFLDADNSVVRNCWGMKEMYIAAAFLRGIPLADMEAGLSPDRLEIIQVCAMDDSGNTRCSADECDHFDGSCTGKGDCVGDDQYKNLGFRLWVPKAKKLAIMVDDVNVLLGAKEGLRTALRQNGVDVLKGSTVAAGGTDVLHRYGVWLSQSTVSDQVRASLPVDLVMSDAKLGDLIRHKLEISDVEGLIGDVTGLVLKQNLARLKNKTEIILFTNRTGGPFQEISCGRDLTELDVQTFAGAVVFDWHGSGINPRNPLWVARGKLKPDQVLDKFAFYESFRTPFPQNGLFPSLASDMRDEFAVELLWAALTPVVIIDERFQRIAEQDCSPEYNAAVPNDWQTPTYKNEFTMGRIWKRMRVYVPKGGEECSLEQPRLENIQGYLKAILDEIGKGVYVVIHQSVLEKLGASESELTSYLACRSQKDNWVNVVCSGRGVPWQLMRNAPEQAFRPRFVALASLLECLERMPSKVHLMRLLEVTRAPK